MSNFDPAKVIRTSGGLLAATGAATLVGTVVAANEVQNRRGYVGAGRGYDEDVQIAAAAGLFLGVMSLGIGLVNLFRPIPQNVVITTTQADGTQLVETGSTSQT